jgi:putative inorganic carbon (HCO3(-)) transporter
VSGNPQAKTPAANPSNAAHGRIVPARASTILERVIFYTLLVLIVISSTPYGIVNPWRGAVEAIYECGVFILGALWMIEGILSGSWVTRKHLLLIPFLLLIIFAYLQTISLGSSPDSTGLSVPAWQAISFDPYETRLMVLKLLAYALALGILLRYTSTPGRLRVLVLTIIGIGVASALFGILRQTTQQDAPGFLFPSVLLNGGYGQFVNRNHFAFLMEMALGLSLGFIASGGGRRERVLVYLTVAIPIWVALVLSNSRGGILSMLCQLLLLALMFTVVRNQGQSKALGGKTDSRLAGIRDSFILRLTLGACLLAATLIGIVWTGGEETVSRFEKIKDEISVEAEETVYGVRRKEIWGATWRMIKDHPLTGVGLGGYWTAIPQYHRASGKMTPQQAHNDYLEYLASVGLIGLLILGWAIFLFIKYAREGLRSSEPFRRAACFGAITGLFGISIHSLVDFGLHIPINALVCLALVSIAIADVYVTEGKRL